ncbi:MAG: response regulator [Nitrososphaera sp.]|nr:response regulator [Nitrososphaera sp.]
MKVLVAEDEPVILMQYKLVLEARGHKVVSARDGEECAKLYDAEMKVAPDRTCPFGAVLLDYRMPKLDGMGVAKHILAKNPRQRIIIASAFTKEALIDSVKQLRQVIELLQKPFDLDTLADVIEDKEIFVQLETLNVKVKEIKDLNPTHEQVRDLLEGLHRLYGQQQPQPA